VALSASARAASMHQGSAGSNGSVSGSLPGEVLWTYYETTEPLDVCLTPIEGEDAQHFSGSTTVSVDTDGCNHGGEGDNIIRLVNPNGAANGNLAGARPQPVCAMFYVFDDDEEMGECCGCPLSSAQLATFSVEKNLTSDWALQGGEAGDQANGAIAVIAASPNSLLTCSGQSGACHGGCDPTNVPGYSVTSTNNLLGSVTHNQVTVSLSSGTLVEISGITETVLSDDGGGDPINLIYLQEQCGALVGNSTGGGICNCPTE
jgi:hypothetical protein